MNPIINFHLATSHPLGFGNMSDDDDLGIEAKIPSLGRSIPSFFERAHVLDELPDAATSYRLLLDLLCSEQQAIDGEALLLSTVASQRFPDNSSLSSLHESLFSTEPKPKEVCWAHIQDSGINLPKTNTALERYVQILVAYQYNRVALELLDLSDRDCGAFHADPSLVQRLRECIEIGGWKSKTDVLEAVERCFADSNLGGTVKARRLVESASEKGLFSLGKNLNKSSAASLAEALCHLRHEFMTVASAENMDQLHQRFTEKKVRFSLPDIEDPSLSGSPLIPKVLQE